MLPARRRLSKKEINSLPSAEKIRLAGSNFDLVVFPAQSAKFAFLISKKVATGAVKRNLIKRKISRVIENSLELLNLSKAVLVIVKKDVSVLSDKEIETELAQLLLRKSDEKNCS